MTFASLEFAVLLTATFLIYYLLPQRGRMLLLLGVSYVFYCYWDAVYGLLILGSTILDYGSALFIAKTESGRRKRWWLLLSVTGNLGLLGYFKYTDFALESLLALLGPLGAHLPPPMNLVLPAGISFYTFQTMSYTIDVYRGTQKAEKDFVLVALYVAFFPQLVAGPIERAASLFPQLQVKRSFRFQDIETGIRLIGWGLFKKIVVADRLICAAYGAYLNPGAQSTGVLTFTVLAMYVAVYLDYSAYSEIARGTAALFGIRLSRNFYFPHKAINIADYWRRWHITLSSWVKDYVYAPLGGFKTSRTSWKGVRLMMITMGLVGLWHGAKWTFVLWGLVNGACLVIYQMLKLYVFPRCRHWRFLNSTPWFFISWMSNMMVRVATSILFFSPDLQSARVFFSRLFLQPAFAGFNAPYVQIGIGVIVLFWVFHYWHEQFEKRGTFCSWPPAVRAGIYVSLAFTILFGALDSAEPFIYFQF